MSAPARAGDRITEVSGIAVGHHSRLDPAIVVATPEAPGSGWATGTTVVTVPSGAVVAVDVRGGGPGTREPDLLDPSNTVQTAHAIVLSGGSAFGLAAAHHRTTRAPGTARAPFVAWALSRDGLRGAALAQGGSP